MPFCEACGSFYRMGARFCWNCAAPLPAPVGDAPNRPTQEDTCWLSATLCGNEASHAAAGGATGYTRPFLPLSVDPEEVSMEPSHSVGPALFAGRYAVLSEDQQGHVEVLDHEPWRRCWACDSRSNAASEAFCADCGAALEQRRYRGLFVPAAAPIGLALVGEVTDAAARAVLPDVWDQVEQDGRIMVLVRESGYDPLEPPVDELIALRIGVDLANLLAVLHAQGLVLGQVLPADIEMTVAERPRLSAVAGLQRIGTDPDRAIQSDLQELAGLLESLTDTPRTTQRLGEDEVIDVVQEPDLATLLRQMRTGTIATASELAAHLMALLQKQTTPVPLRQHVGMASDTGMVREHNEDSFLALDLALDNNAVRHVWGLYIVADGMGGHAAGEVASGLAIRGASELILREYLAPTLDRDAAYSDEQAHEIVQRAALQANHYVLNEGRTHGNDMGTTLTLALVVGDRVTIANVGDSRAYIYRAGKLRRVSRDHSLVMRLVELGQITEDEIYTHPQRNAVLRSLGDKADIEVDLFAERVLPGDSLLLCSDGQWEMTRDADIERILAAWPDDPQAACQQLIAAANQAGGEDNITAVLVQFVA